MNRFQITPEHILAYEQYLLNEERSAGTIEKYLKDVKAFANWLEGEPVTKAVVADWKAYLQKMGYASVTINSMLAAINSLFSFLGWEDFRIKFLKIQRRVFRDPAKELTRREYERLLSTACELGKERLALLMETI